jgi:trimeric autotransporter adhesin
MNKSKIFLATAMLAGSVAMAAPPAAPSVTAGADYKVLRFDWDPVPQSNYYELWFKADAGSSFVKFGEIPGSRTRTSNNVSAHLLNWQQARYQVRACNSSGCTASPDIPVNALMQDSLGYLKSPHSAPSGRFGTRVTISEDGATMALTSAFEADAGLAYVYRKTGGRWVLEAQLMPGGYQGSSDAQVTLSNDGSVLAMTTFENSAQGFGAVYIYRRTGTSWQLEQRLAGGPREDFEIFGENPRLTSEGNWLQVNYSDGRSEIHRHASSGWTLYRQFKAAAGTGTLPVLSGDGQVLARCVHVNGAVAVEIDRTEVPDNNVKTIVVAAASQQHYCSAIDIDYLGATIAVGHSPSAPVTDAWNPRVAVVRASGSGYLVTSQLAPGSWQRTIGNRPSSFGDVVRLSWNGEYLAITDVNDSGAGHDVVQPPLATSSIATGAVYVFERRGGEYGLRKVLKPHVVNAPDFHFGEALAFGSAGKALVVGHPSERSGSGTDGNRDDTSADFSGAVWLY